MKCSRIGRFVLLAGIILLVVALLLMIFVDIFLASIFLFLSILVNVTGLTLIFSKR